MRVGLEVMNPTRIVLAIVTSSDSLAACAVIEVKRKASDSDTGACDSDSESEDVGLSD